MLVHVSQYARTANHACPPLYCPITEMEKIMKTEKMFLAACLLMSSALAVSTAMAEADETISPPAEEAAEPEARVFTSEHEI